MVNILKKIRYAIVTLCYSLYYTVAMIYNRKEILHDVEFWNEQIGANDNLQMYLFQYPAFRNLFYYRLRNHRALVEILKIFCRPMYGFELNAKSIGSLMAYHPYSTLIDCERIGEKVIVLIIAKQFRHLILLTQKIIHDKGIAFIEQRGMFPFLIDVADILLIVPMKSRI